MGQNIITALESGVRRSDLPLVRTCIEVLWESDRGGLIRQAPLMVLRNAWYFVREYAELLQERQDKATYLKIFGRLAVTPTNRDAMALPMLINGHEGTIPAELIKPYAEAKSLLQHPSGFRGAAEWWISEKLSQRTRYEQSAGLVIQDVIKGLVTDLVEKPESSQDITRNIQICMAALFLIDLQGLPKKKTQDLIVRSSKRYAKEHPKTGRKSISSFAFGQNSDIGKAAIEKISQDPKLKKLVNGIDIAEMWRLNTFDTTEIHENETWWQLLKFKHDKQWRIIGKALQDEVFRQEVRG
jgi:hypothetical protein